MSTLGEILGGIAGAAGDIFTAKANAEAAQAQATGAGSLAILQAQQAQQQAQLNAQTTQRTTMYVAMAVVGLVAFMMLAKKV